MLDNLINDRHQNHDNFRKTLKVRRASDMNGGQGNLLDGLDAPGGGDFDTDSRNGSERKGSTRPSIHDSSKRFSKRDVPAVEVRYSSEEYSFSSDADLEGEEEGDELDSQVPRLSLVGKEEELYEPAIKGIKRTFNTEIECFGEDILSHMEAEGIKQRKTIQTLREQEPTDSQNTTLNNLTITEYEETISQTRFKMVKKDLYNLLQKKFGPLSAFKVAHSAKILSVAFHTKQFILGSFLDEDDTFEFKEFKIDNKDVVCCIEYIEDEKLLLTGYMNGDINVYKYEIDKLKLKLGLIVNEATNCEILEIGSLGNPLDCMFVIDAECRLLASNRNPKSKEGQYDFNLIELLHRERIPKTSIFRGANHHYLAVTAGDFVYLYTYPINKKGNAGVLEKKFEFSMSGQENLIETVPIFGNFVIDHENVFYLAVTAETSLHVYHLIAGSGGKIGHRLWTVA